MRLVDLWLDLGASNASFFSVPRGIAQGAILSPLFCNLYLNDLDQALHAKKVPFVRYADDFLLFAADEQGARRAHDYAAEVLDQLDLRLNSEKTRITLSGPHVTFLGQRLRRYDPRKAPKKA